MSIHIAAKPGQIAKKVLMPGDPLRAKFIADNFLKEVICYNTVRNMFGFTGLTETEEMISVQGSGMGMPSLSIYVNELMRDYGVKQIIRVGSAGSLKKEITCRDIIISPRAYSDSGMHADPNHPEKQFRANKELISKLHRKARELGIKVSSGNVFSTDIFYDDKEVWKQFAGYGAVCVEMESAELYSLGKKYNIQTASILTISDTLAVKSEPLSAEEREKSFHDMMRIALGV